MKFIESGILFNLFEYEISLTRSNSALVEIAESSPNATVVERSRAFEKRSIRVERTNSSCGPIPRRVSAGSGELVPDRIQDQTAYFGKRAVGIPCALLNRGGIVGSNPSV